MTFFLSCYDSGDTLTHLRDIVKMYRMINIVPKQRKYQRIFWRSDSSQVIKCFELKTVTYGTASAPFLAVGTLHNVAENCDDETIAEVIIKQFYMDDVVFRAATIEELWDIKTRLTNVMNNAGFILDKWRSNVHADANLSDKNLTVESDSKILGVSWDCTNDQICYSFSYAFKQDVISKRNILSIIAQFFDSLGILAPIIIAGKLIMQDLWKEKIAWDDPVPRTIQLVWLDYRNQLNLINHIKIPRHALVQEAISIELHGFSDGSERAYGACLYVRSLNKAGDCQVHLLCAKVAPLKVVTIPRLELCAALLLAKFFHNVTTAMNLNFSNSYFWCDSTIVLNWISAHPSKWKIFVANRVTQIQELTNPVNWRYINGVYITAHQNR